MTYGKNCEVTTAFPPLKGPPTVGLNKQCKHMISFTKYWEPSL